MVSYAACYTVGTTCEKGDRMEPFGQVIQPDGFATARCEPVWSSKVQILKITENGQITYSVRYQKTDDRGDIDAAVRKALDTVAQQLTGRASSKG